MCESQRGEKTVVGEATVLLPSRTEGPAVIPTKDAGPTPMKNEFSVDTPGSVW